MFNISIILVATSINYSTALVSTNKSSVPDYFYFSNMRHIQIFAYTVSVSLCSFTQDLFDVVLDENQLDDACDHLAEYLEAYYRATHPGIPPPHTQPGQPNNPQYAFGHNSATNHLSPNQYGQPTSSGGLQHEQINPARQTNVSGQMNYNSLSTTNPLTNQSMPYNNISPYNNPSQGHNGYQNNSHIIDPHMGQATGSYDDDHLASSHQTGLHANDTTTHDHHKTDRNAFGQQHRYTDFELEHPEVTVRDMLNHESHRHRHAEDLYYDDRYADAKDRSMYTDEYMDDRGQRDTHSNSAAYDGIYDHYDDYDRHAGEELEMRQFPSRNLRYDNQDAYINQNELYEDHTANSSNRRGSIEI